MNNYEINNIVEKLEDIVREIFEKQRRIRTVKLDLDNDICDVQNMIDKANKIIWSLKKEITHKEDELPYQQYEGE